jgi:hypothetical protein
MPSWVWLVFMFCYFLFGLMMMMLHWYPLKTWVQAILLNPHAARMASFKIGISEPIRIVNRHYHSPQGMAWSYRACQSIRKLMQFLAYPWSAAQLDRVHLPTIRPSAQLSSNLLLNLLKQIAADLLIVDYLKFF